jgi:hypothetical protein
MSAAAATANTCPICLEEKPAADDEGHCSYACASGGGSVTHATRVTEAPAAATGLILTTLANGRIQVSGATFPVRDQIKARGGRWDPAARAWTLPAGTNTVFAAAALAAPAPAPAAAVVYYVRRDRLGRCCRAATTALDAENPYGPMWYHCKLHGSCKSSYTGD